VSQDPAIVILTFNSAEVIERTVRAAQQVSSTIICVDSGSTDGTPDILRRLGCEVHNRAFKHYADQRNWTIQTFGNAYTWQLHLDADEVLDDLAIASLRGALQAPGEHAGFLLKRLTYFMGRPLRFAGENSWHLRLFRSGQAACEDRLYDQHFTCTGPIARLKGLMHDVNVGSISEWTARHNRWSDLEVSQLRTPSGPAGALQGELSADPRKRRRLYRGIFYRLPRGWRAVGYFLVRYVLQLGFLDGRVGFYYNFFQSFWFRMLIDAKLDAATAAEAAREKPDVQSQPGVRPMR
jgi:glycosyltransferase involved in cell wall biosynthesis